MMSDLDEAISEPSDARPSDPAWLRPLALVSATLNKWAAGIAALLLVLMTGHILVEIVLRFFSHSTYMVNAFVAYGVAALTFLAAPWALEQGSMIRVSVLTGLLPFRGRWMAEIFAVIVTLAISVFLFRYEVTTVIRLFELGRTSSTYIPIPLWIPEAIFVTGLSLLSLHLFVRLLRLVTVGMTDENELVI